MTTINIGDFNERVQFLQPTRTANQSGGGTESDVPLLDCWAKVVVKRTDRSQEANRAIIGANAQLWCRYRNELALTPETKVIALGKTWKVQGFVLIDNKKGLYQFEISSNGAAYTPPAVSYSLVTDSNGDIITDGNGDSILA